MNADGSPEGPETNVAVCRITIGASTSPQRLGITRVTSKSEKRVS